MLAVDGYGLARATIDAGVETIIVGEPVDIDFQSLDSYQFNLGSGSAVDINSDFFTSYPGDESAFGGDSVSTSSVVVDGNGELLDRIEELQWNFLVYANDNADGTWSYTQTYSATYDVNLDPQTAGLNPTAETGQYNYTLLVSSDGTEISSEFTGTRTHVRSGAITLTTADATATGNWWFDTTIELSISTTYDIASGTLTDRTVSETWDQQNGFTASGTYSYEVSDGEMSGTFSESFLVTAMVERGPAEYSITETADYDRNFNGTGTYSSTFDNGTISGNSSGTMTESGGEHWDYQSSVVTQVAADGIQTIQSGSAGGNANDEFHWSLSGGGTSIGTDFSGSFTDTQRADRSTSLTWTSALVIDGSGTNGTWGYTGGSGQVDDGAGSTRSYNGSGTSSSGTASGSFSIVGNRADNTDYTVYVILDFDDQWIETSGSGTGMNSGDELTTFTGTATTSISMKTLKSLELPISLRTTNTITCTSGMKFLSAMESGKRPIVTASTQPVPTTRSAIRQTAPSASLIRSERPNRHFQEQQR